LTGHSNSVLSLAVLENGYFASGSYHININNIEFQERFSGLVLESKNNTKIPKKALQSFTLVVLKYDIKDAFDTVDHKKLIEKLKKLNVNDKIYKWKEKFLQEAVTQVLINKSKSVSFGRTRGIPQGLPLGPILFNIYIDDIIDQVVEEENIYFFLLMIS